MIEQRCQRIRNVVVGHNRDLIGDAEIQLDAFIEHKTPKHYAWADQELVSAGARAARPLRSGHRTSKR
jgi:hypothetical protein